MTAEATMFNPGPETYERELVPTLFRDWAGELVALADPMPAERVLDVATGTGIVARTAAAYVLPGGTVTGYDVNPAMLEVARRQAEAEGAEVTWQEGDATAMPFPDGAFDVVLCQQGVQFFSDRLRGLAEMRRVSAPNGRVVLSAWLSRDQHPIYGDFDAALGRHLHGEALESDAPFSLPPYELRELLADAGFSQRHLRIVARPVRFRSPEGMLSAITGAHVPLAEAVAALDAGARVALEADLCDSLRAYVDDDGLVCPMIASVVVARP